MTEAVHPVVLIVEDEPIVLMNAMMFVESAGFEVISATSADQAVQILESRLDVRIVFTDIDMPGSMDGMKLAAAIRGRWPPIELIVTSGNDITESDLPLRGLFFSKPYLATDIVSAMHSFALPIARATP